MAYTAVISWDTTTNLISKFMNFGTEIEAQAHVEAYGRPGAFVAPAPDGPASSWVVDPDNLGLTSSWVEPSVDLHAHLAEIRRAHETGGVTATVGSDVIDVATDQEGRTNLLGARVAAEQMPDFTTVWSANNGRFELDAAGIIALSNAVLAHINGAFIAQAAIVAQIDAGTLTTPEEVEAAFAAEVAGA
ncbi:DUF4376 domain-containing protein [Stappia stellulata]|uniref:DUF4376 domain-containing protein n=1 Tax=Stappia stellulata TaxID=71235 RepID=UPI000A003026|nr:DUF4376 domain-containing protein [Stappia stellulata]